TVEYAFHHFLGRSLGVGVFDSQDEDAAVPPREEPVEERSPGAADVEIPGRRRGESNTRRQHEAILQAISGLPAERRGWKKSNVDKPAIRNRRTSSQTCEVRPRSRISFRSPGPAARDRRRRRDPAELVKAVENAKHAKPPSANQSRRARRSGGSDFGSRCTA